MKIVVSACLLGKPCRFDGQSKPHEALIAFCKDHEVLSLCPEEAGGLPTPRPPSEIVSQTDSNNKKNAARRVINSQGLDVTQEFICGAQRCLSAAKEMNCELAILKARSPSCGSGEIYDGTFTNTITSGWGITAAAFRDAGIMVVNEHNYLSVLD